MSIIKTFFIIIIIVIISSCSVQKKNIGEKLTNDDYEIINLLLDKFTDTIFYNDAKTVYVVYDDSMMIKKQILNQKAPKGTSIKLLENKKISNKKIFVVADEIFDAKKEYPKTAYKFQKNRHKFIIKDFYYNDTKTEAFLNYYDIIHTPIYGTLWGGTFFYMRYKKENGKWIELGNFYQGYY